MHPVARHPGDGDARRERPRQHRPRERRLGLERRVLWHARLRAPRAIVGPPLGQVQLPVEEGAPARRGVGEEDPDPAVLDPPRRAAVLPLHADRLATLLEEAGLVDDQDRLSSPGMMRDRPAKCNCRS